MENQNNIDIEEKDKASESFLWRLWNKSRKKESGASTEAAETDASPALDQEEVSKEAYSASDRMTADKNFLASLREHLLEFPMAELFDEARAAQIDAAPDVLLIGVPPAPLLYSSFALDGKEPLEELKRYLDRSQRTAQQRLEEFLRLQQQEQQRLEGAEQETQDALKTETPPPSPVDYLCEVVLTRDSMQAFLFCYPPAFGGAAPTLEGLRAVLEAQKVTAGIDEGRLAAMAEKPIYLKLVSIAHGVAAVDGTDGKIIDLIPREQRITYEVHADGSVNYKDLNWLRRIQAGDCICEIIAPIPPAQGYTVAGRKLEGRIGKQPQPPMGKNTALSEDGTALLATLDGQISFKEGRFHVVQVTTIPGNVDSGVGNLDVIGDLLVEGDIQEGFQVKTTGNLIVRGMIEGANVTVGGNIQIINGMNGNSHGTLVVGGDILSKFLENGVVECGGCIRSDSLINCQTTCDDTVDITSGRGVIIGGSVTACHLVKAKVIGNKSSRVTNITIGITPSFLREKKSVTKEVQALAEELDQMEKNMTYLDRAKALTPELQALRNQIKLRLTVVRLQHSKATKHLEAMDAQRNDLSSCFVESDEIYPITQVTIGYLSTTISTLTRHCRVFSSIEGLVVGIR